jgi:hypothetical protein
VPHGQLATLRQQPWILRGQCLPQPSGRNAVALRASPGRHEEDVRLVDVCGARRRGLDAVPQHPRQVVLPGTPLLNVANELWRTSVCTVPGGTVVESLVAEFTRQVVDEHARADRCTIGRCTGVRRRAMGAEHREQRGASLGRAEERHSRVSNIRVVKRT